ncbi:hypothetical protein [Desulfobulbus propionicus]
MKKCLSRQRCGYEPMIKKSCCFFLGAMMTAAGVAAAEPPAASEPLVASAGIEQPAPLMPGNLAVEEGRNPFSAPRKRLSTAGYGKVVEGCQLRGIIRVGGRQVGLFVVEGEGGQSKSEDDVQLRRVRVGEQIRVLDKDEEHVLTVRYLGERSAVIVGENNQQYKVWL